MLAVEQPFAFHALNQLFTALLQRRQWEEAVAVGRRYVQAYPDDVGGIEHIAGLLGVAGRYADQIELIARLVARRPEYNSLCLLGFALDRSGNHRRAVEVLKQATRMRPDDFLALHYLGEAYIALGRHEDAIAAYQAELVVRPRSTKTRHRIQALRAAIAAR